MTQDQAVYLEMTNVTTGVMDNNDKLWKSNTKISEAVDNVKGTVVEIGQIAIAQGKRTTGATNTKNDLWDSTALNAEHICNGLKAYYDDMKDKTGFAVVDFCDTDFDSGNFKDACNNMKIVYDVAGGLKIADLLLFNVVAGDITDLGTAIDLLKNTAPANRIMRVSKKGATSQLKTKFALLLQQIDTLDLRVKTLKRDNPEFWEVYDFGRKQIHTGKGHETEVVVLKPGVFVSLFGKEFTLGDVFTVRNTGSEIPITVGITDHPTEMPTTNLISIASKADEKLTIGEDFGGLLGHYLMIMNPSGFADANVTVLKAKGN